MDTPIEKPMRISIRKGKADMKVGEIKQRNKIKSKEDRYVEKHHEGSFGVTEKDFIAILAKASQPIKDGNISKSSDNS